MAKMRRKLNPASRLFSGLTRWFSAQEFFEARKGDTPNKYARLHWPTFKVKSVDSRQQKFRGQFAEKNREFSRLFGGEPRSVRRRMALDFTHRALGRRGQSLEAE